MSPAPPLTFSIPPAPFSIQSAVIAAVLNTLIPLRLGELVNTVSRLEPSLTLQQYSSLLGPTALSLITLYVTQVSLPFSSPLLFFPLLSSPLLFFPLLPSPLLPSPPLSSSFLPSPLLSSHQWFILSSPFLLYQFRVSVLLDT